MYTLYQQNFSNRKRLDFAMEGESVNSLGIFIISTSFYFLLIPQQFSFSVGNLFLTPARVFMIGASLYLMPGLLRGNLRIRWPDMMVVGALAWIWLASYMTSGSSLTSIEMGGSHILDIGVPYFLARSTIRTPDDLRRFLVLIAPGVAVTGVMIAAESLSRTYIVQPIASALTGRPMPISYEIRMGLLRGTASFPHPILAGITMASFLPLYFLSGLRGWPRVVGVVGSIIGMFSMSSAAVLGVVVSGFLLACDWISERVANFTWKIFLFFGAILYLTVEFGSKSGFYSILIRYASFNTGSAYNRVLIWKYGTQNIERHPWFGIGYADWVRPDWMVWDSFDHFWLINALRFGIPVGVLLLGATLLAIASLAWKSGQYLPHDSRLVRGVVISLSVFALGVNSVTLWLSALAWFFMLLGIAVSLGSIRFNGPDAQFAPRRRPYRHSQSPRSEHDADRSASSQYLNG